MLIDDGFELPELQGKVVEELLGVLFEPRDNFIFSNREVELDAVILKLKDVTPLQLFYLDAGLGFWEDLAEADYPDYVDKAEIFSPGEASEIQGQKIVRAGCKGNINEGTYCKIAIDLKSMKVELRYDESKEKTLLCFS